MGSLFNMNASEVKSHKERLRQINNHLSLAHDEMGVQRDAIGFVEVVHHPTYILPSLNYVTPRRRTALVPGTHVEEGVVALRDYRREVRVLYIEQLFPAFFGKSLEKIGLKLQEKYPLWVMHPIPHRESSLPSRVTVNTIIDRDGIDIWSLIWRNANYKVHGTPLEPLIIGKHYVPQKRVIDVVLYHHDKPLAVARLTIYDRTAHLMARAILQSTQPLRLQQWLIEAALHTVAAHDCEFMFVCDAEFDKVLAVTTDLPCQLEGNMLCYSDQFDDRYGEEMNDAVEQPVLLT